LTYDDGPHATLTPQLLDILAAYNLRAIFFMVGQRVGPNAGIVRRMVAEGHTVGNHSYTHPLMTNRSVTAQRAELGRTQEAIRAACGVYPTLFRPPYGATNAALETMARNEFGLRTMMWDVDTRDYRRPGAQVVANRILAAYPGQVVLMHDIHPGTITASAIAFRQWRGNTV
jgi:peptidoglycan/xylan/chitin deacetylase (PgdA/CDA1 family)